jgi:hypothetical protein
VRSLAVAFAAAAATTISTTVNVQLASGGAAHLPAFAGCFSNAPQLRPRTILVACGDGNFFITRLRWSHWDAHYATALGTGHQNDCKPDCARGHFHSYGVALHLSRPETCRNRRREFTRFSYRFVADKPPGVVRGDTLTSPFYLGTGCP